MPTTPHSSTVQLTDQDRAYAGSTFREVVDALFANPYQRVWGREGEPPLPIYEVSLQSVFGGLIPIGKPDFFRKASERALDSGADLRWGPDGKGCEPSGASERVVPDRTMADHRGDRILGVLQPGEHGARDRAVLDVLHGDAAWHHSVAVDGGQALSDHEPATRHTASDGQLHHARRHRRQRHGVHQRCRTAQRSRHDRVATGRGAPRFC